MNQVAHNFGIRLGFPWPFAACFTLLLVAGFGLNPLLDGLSEYYRKTSIQPQKPLAELTADKMSSFVPAPDDSPFIDPQTDNDVGADDIVLIRLQESGAVGKDGQVILLVTYYSDPDDRVPHTPEVCYRQIGGIVRSLDTIEIQVGENQSMPRSFEARTVVIEEPNVNAVIAYTFCVNGDFVTTRNAVRLAMGIPGPKRVYFAKVEAVTASAPDADPKIALARCTTLLKEALPVLIEEHFPTREDIKRR